MNGSGSYFSSNVTVLIIITLLQVCPETVKTEILRILNAWAYGFRNEPKYKIVEDTRNLMRMEGMSVQDLSATNTFGPLRTLPRQHKLPCNALWSIALQSLRILYTFVLRTENGYRFLDVGINFPCVIQKYTKFAIFTGLHFPHFTTFRNQTLQFY